MSGTATTITVPDTKITNSMSILQRLLNVPDKGTQAKVLVSLVFLTECLKDRRNLIVRDHCQNSVVLFRPGVISIMRGAIDSSPALNVQPLGKTSLAMILKQFDNLVAIGLIV